MPGSPAHKEEWGRVVPAGGRATASWPRNPAGTIPANRADVTPEELQDRTLSFSLAVYRFIRPLLAEVHSKHIALQLLRSATAVAANYRAACLARSKKEWTAKLGVIREEADESVLWLIFIERAGIVSKSSKDLGDLTDEARQLTRIFVAAYATSKANLTGKRRQE